MSRRNMEERIATLEIADDRKSRVFSMIEDILRGHSKKLMTLEAAANGDYGFRGDFAAKPYLGKRYHGQAIMLERHLAVLQRMLADLAGLREEVGGSQDADYAAITRTVQVAIDKIEAVIGDRS